MIWLHSIQRSIDNRLRTRFTYVVKGGSWLVINTAVSSVAAIVVVVFLGNILEPSVYGTYKYMISLFAFAGAFSLNGFKQVISQSIARGNLDFFIVGSRTYFRWGVIMSIIALIGSLYYYLQENAVLATSMLLIAIFIPFHHTFGLYGTYAGGTAEFKLHVKQNLLFTIIPTIAIVLTAFYTKNALLVFVAFLVSRTLINGLIYYVVRNKVTQPTQEYQTEQKFAKQLSFVSMFGKVVATLDNIFVFQFLGATQLAIYSFATALPKQMSSSQKILGILALPRFTNRTLSDLKTKMLQKIVIAYLFVLVLIVTYWVSAPYIFSLVFPQYVDSVIYSQYISLTLLTIPTAMLKQALTSHMLRKRLYPLEISVPAIRLVLLFVLVMLYDLWGVVASLLIVSCYQTIYLFFAFFTAKTPPKSESILSETSETMSV